MQVLYCFYYVIFIIINFMKNKYPNLIPVFPLSGVIYFPETNLPLNIFEPRYLDLINDTLKKDKLMGMVQAKRDSDEVYNVVCLGKISDYKKTNDGRVLVNLMGITRFEIKKEVKNKKLYREFEVDYEKFKEDFEKNNNIFLSDNNFKSLLEKTKVFFKKNGLLLNWPEFEKLDRLQQINTIAMISPVTNEEKQKVLETVTNKDKTEILSNIIEFYLYEKNSTKITIN